MRRNLSRPDAENPEWTEEDFRRARPALKVLPKDAVFAIRRTKVLVSLRIDRDVVEAYRATGAGWQTRANEALRAYAKQTGIDQRSLSRVRTAKRRTVATKRP